MGRNRQKIKKKRLCLRDIYIEIGKDSLICDKSINISIKNYL